MKLRAILIAILFSMLFTSFPIEAAKIKPAVMRLGLLSKSLSVGIGYLTGKILDVNECETPVSIFVGLMTTCFLYPLLRWYEKRHIPENILHKRYLNTNDEELIEIAATHQNIEVFIGKIANRYLYAEEYLLVAFYVMNNLHKKLVQKNNKLVYACSLCDLQDEDDQKLYKQIEEEISKIQKIISDVSESIMIIKSNDNWSNEINRKNIKEAKAMAYRAYIMAMTPRYYGSGF